MLVLWGLVVIIPAQCQIVCQIVCQIICQIICQIACQIILVQLYLTVHNLAGLLTRTMISVTNSSSLFVVQKSVM